MSGPIEDWDALARALGQAVPQEASTAAQVPTVPTDHAFVQRVMATLPTPLRGGRLRPARRIRLLAAFHLGGAVLLLGLWAMLPELSAGAASWVHDRASEGAEVLGASASLSSWPVVVGAVAALFGVVLALAPTRIDTRPT